MRSVDQQSIGFFNGLSSFYDKTFTASVALVSRVFKYPAINLVVSHLVI